MSTKDPSNNNSAAIKQKLILGLFVGMALLQILDFHSTVTAHTSKTEVNTFILRLSSYTGFVAAIGIIKIICLGVISIMYKAWRNVNGIYDSEFLCCLSIVTVAYMLVVAQNYFS